LSAPRVLVVDDEPAVLGLISHALAARGYEVQAAPDPLQALKLAHDAPCFDLVVSDVIMPQMCGPELVRRITQICPGTAVLVMSGHIDVQDLPKGAKFIGKPFQVKDLYSIVDRALASSPTASGPRKEDGPQSGEPSRSSA